MSVLLQYIIPAFSPGELESREGSRSLPALPKPAEDGTEGRRMDQGSGINEMNRIESNIIAKPC